MHFCATMGRSWWYFADMIITPILSGAVMEFIGYRYLYLYAIVCALLAALPLVMVQKGNTILLKDLDLDHPTGELLEAGN